MKKCMIGHHNWLSRHATSDLGGISKIYVLPNEVVAYSPPHFFFLFPQTDEEILSGNFFFFYHSKKFCASFIYVTC